MNSRLFVLLAGMTFCYTSGARQVGFTGDFESGQVRPSYQMQDGFYIGTLPNPQVGLQAVVGGSGGFGPSSSFDTRVVGTELVGGETEVPRKGNYFLRSSLYYQKSYDELNGATVDPDRPRSKILLSNPVHRVDYDVEGYVGFSIYTPRNYEHETGIRDSRGSISMFAMNADTSRTFMVLTQYVQNPSTEAHWWLMYWTDPRSVNESQATKSTVDLGPVNPDLGKWTDFVVRYRVNPFSVATNPAASGIPNSKNRTYEGNKGILQVWKAEGPVNGGGNRTMVRKFSKLNSPVGLVPHATSKLMLSWQLYKYGWKRNNTSVRGPIWFGFDEIRHGLVIRDGTGYADVSPSGLACTSGCELRASMYAPELAIE